MCISRITALTRLQGVIVGDLALTVNLQAVYKDVNGTNVQSRGVAPQKRKVVFLASLSLLRDSLHALDH